MGEGEGQGAARRERFGVREQGHVGGAEPGRDVVVGDPSGERRDIAESRAQRRQEALLAGHPWVLTTCHHEVNRRARVAGGGEDGLDALVRRDEPEAEHGEAVVESQSAPGIAGRERRDVLDAVGDHRRRRHDLAKGGLVNDGRRACPCDGGLHGGDPDAGDRGWNADAMKVGVLAVDRCRIDDLMHRGDE